MEELYDKLYDIVNDNIQAEGGHFITSKQVFLEIMCNSDSEKADIDRLYHLEGGHTPEEYLNIVYIAVLDRIVSSADIDVYRRFFSLPEPEFRKRVLKNVVYSVEAKTKAKHIVNADIIKRSLYERLKTGIISFMYLNIYLSLPPKYKRQIKKWLKR